MGDAAEQVASRAFGLHLDLNAPGLLVELLSLNGYGELGGEGLQQLSLINRQAVPLLLQP